MMKPTSKKDRQPHQERGRQHRPDRALAAEFTEQPIRQRAPAARVFEEAADHRAQTDYHGDESERIAEAGLNRFQRLLRSHPRCQSQRHAGQEQRQKGVQPHREDQKQEQSDRSRASVRSGRVRLRA